MSTDSLPRFFYTPTDTCTTANASLRANLVNAPAICAFVPARQNIVWACPTGDRICWARQRGCHGDPEARINPDETEILCRNDDLGYSWCCDKEFESCSRTRNQHSVCWSKFANAISDVEPSVAIQIPSLSVGYSSSTTIQSSTTTRRSTATSASESKSIRSQTTQPVQTTTQAIQTTTPIASPAKDNLSSGVIAGIVLGSVVVLLVLIIAFLLLLRLRRQKQEQSPEPARPYPDTMTYMINDYRPQRPPTELDSPAHTHIPELGYQKHTSGHIRRTELPDNNIEWPPELAPITHEKTGRL